MTTVHDCVKETMINYNSSFDTRWKVLHHVFFCIGTGYYWGGNAIFSDAYASEKRWKKDQKAALSVDDFLYYFDKNEEKRSNFISSMQKDPAISDLHRKFFTFHANFLVEHIDVLVDNNITIDDSQLPKTSYIDGGNSLFWHPPTNMNKDWREALVEAGTIMLKLIKNHYANGDDSSTAVWSGNHAEDAKKVYFEMKEHVELVRTGTYTFKAPKRRKGR